jgi:hypothetical protein
MTKDNYNCCCVCGKFMDKGTEVSFKLDKFYIKTSILICQICIQDITIGEFFDLCQPLKPILPKKNFLNKLNETKK